MSSDKKGPCSCSEGKKKKRVKHGRRPLPDLNYPPPSSSSSSPSSSSSYNYDKVPHFSLQICICFITYKLLCETDLIIWLQVQVQLLESAPEHTPPDVGSRKRKIGERESESSSGWMKAWWNKAMDYIIYNLKKKMKKEDDDPAQ